MLSEWPNQIVCPVSNTISVANLAPSIALSAISAVSIEPAAQSKSPVTVSDPATVVLPVDALTVNLLVLISKLPSTPVACNWVAPSTFKVPSKSVAPVTSNVPGTSILLVHSTAFPAALVWSNCLAAPSLILTGVTDPSSNCQVEIGCSCCSLAWNNPWSKFLFKSPARIVEPDANNALAESTSVSL